jgi:hypothetical protein
VPAHFPQSLMLSALATFRNACNARNACDGPFVVTNSMLLTKRARGFLPNEPEHRLCTPLLNASRSRYPDFQSASLGDSAPTERTAIDGGVGLSQW